MKNTLFKDICWLLLLSALVFVLNLWGYPLFDVDEPRYAETAREMLTTPGDWITPHFNWVTRFDKPVLFYWLIAFSYKLFGISAFSARLVSALAATSILVMLYLVGRQNLSRKVGLISAGIFATMLEPYTLARWSVTDMTLACFMTGTWLCLLQVLLRSPRWYLMAGLFAGLGVLTKGPVALALPGLTFLLALLLHHRHLWKRLFAPWIITGFALFLGISLPWYMAVAAANPEDFVGSFFFFHNVERFTTTVSGHSGPWYYYLPVLIIGAFPWIVLVPTMMVTLWKTRNELAPVIRYALVWFLVVFLFFSVAGTKLSTYVLPGFPALALLLGWFVNLLIVNTSSPEVMKEMLPSFTRSLRHITGLLIAVTGAVAIVLILVLCKNFIFVPRALHDIYNPTYTQVLLFLLLLTFATGIFYIRKQQFSRVYLSLQLGAVLLLVFLNLFGLPLAARMMQTDTMAFAQRSVQDGVPLCTYGTKKPSLVFYTQRKVYYMPRHDADFEKENSIFKKDLHVKMPSLYLIVKNKDMDILHRVHHPRLVQAGRVYSLVQVKNAIIRKDINE